MHHSPSPMRARHRLKSISFVAPCVPWPSRDLIWLVVTVAAAARNAGRQKANPHTLAYCERSHGAGTLASHRCPLGLDSRVGTTWKFRKESARTRRCEGSGESAPAERAWAKPPSMSGESPAGNAGDESAPARDEPDNSPANLKSSEIGTEGAE